MELIDREAVREFIKSYRHSTDVAFDMEKHLDEIPAAPRWHRVEDNPPTPGCYLTSSPFFHGDDYSWLYRLAWWTEHGLMDFVQDAEKESGWYIWNNSQDRDTEIEPMYWMPIEPPKEDA